MPVYDLSLRDFLKYASSPRQHYLDALPLHERFEMLKRIYDGLIFMHKEMNKPHRDIKPRPCFENKR